MNSLLVHRGGKFVSKVDLGGGAAEFVMGRASINPICLPSDHVSRKHAVLRRRDGRFFVSDMGSSNGTSVNGRLLGGGEEREVRDGDRIGIDEFELRCVFARETQPERPVIGPLIAEVQQALATEADPRRPLKKTAIRGVTPPPGPAFDLRETAKPPIAAPRPAVDSAPPPPPLAPPPPYAAPSLAASGSGGTPSATFAPPLRASPPRPKTEPARPAALAPPAAAPPPPPAAPPPAAPPPAAPPPKPTTQPPPPAAKAPPPPAPLAAPVPPPPPAPVPASAPPPPAAAPAAAPAEAAGKPHAPPSPVSHARPHDRIVLPTGESARMLQEQGERLTGEQLAKYDIFSDIPAKDIDKHIERYPEDQPPIWLRRFRKGDPICRQGDYGSTAFYITKGAVDIFIQTPMGHVKSLKDDASRKGFFGFVRRFASVIAPSSQDRREEEQPRRYIPIDAPILLPLDNPVGQLGQGELFGEMTCMSFYPRSATCVAAGGEVECLEMLRSVLLELLKRRSKSFNERLEKYYRERALDAHLRSVPIFADLTKEFIDHLRPRVELLSFSPDEKHPGKEIIFRQGDLADAFYLVRLGFVKISQQHPGGDLVLAYLGRGQFFGEMGLLAGGTRTATCTALDHVELVKIRKDDFELMMQKFPEIRGNLWLEAGNRLMGQRKRVENPSMIPLDEFLLQGLINAQNVLLIDLDRCTRCDECVRACAAAHDGVTRLIRDGLRFDKYLVTTSCRACTDPVCMIGCPVGSIRRRNSLEIIIEDWCIGCEKCATQCPYGNINMHPVEALVDDPDRPGRKKAVVANDGKGKAVCCDLCIGLEEPSCVYACPHHAAIRVEPRRFFAPEFATETETDVDEAVRKARAG